ncbi:MAG: outer membrane beta-barrel protein [Candidatus Thiodiazotropha sp. (ex Epidulcina cf. delphinae)]|nr:outer membrane beta-barrel protein [Candidatus Thiodiazotropha sp. (ex Epidulcina cf. delphinae)]
MKPILWILALAACLPPSAAADSGSAGSAWLGLTALAFDYEEFGDQGDSLDREQGPLPGLVAGADLEHERWFVGASLLWLSGDADYTSPAVDTRTDEDILNLELMAGTRLFAWEEQRLSLIAGVGYRKWRRNIRSTAQAYGLDETYRWGYGLLGLRGEHAFNGLTRLVTDLSVTRTINPDLEVRFLQGFDDVGLALGEETGFKVTLALHRQLGRTTILRVAPWYEYWELGRSSDTTLLRNGIPAGVVFEPRSETSNYGVNIGVSWRF